MKKMAVWMLAAALALAAAAYAEKMSLKDAQVDEKKIYFGTHVEFERPAEVDYPAVVQATPEYTELRKRRIQRGTGKYWILMQKASDRGVAAICDMAEKHGHDLVAAKGYLTSLDPAIKPVDLTDRLVRVVQQAE